MSKTVLVTGGAGFIGHHVIKKILLETDWNVVSLDRLDLSGDVNRLAQVARELFSKNVPVKVREYGGGLNAKSRLKIVYHDLKAPISGVTKTMIGKPDIIIHLAAASHVDRSISDPMSFVMDNVVGTANLLEFAREIKTLERFVYFSTDEVFGPAPVGVAYKERDRFNSTNPYSASKAAASQLCVAYRNTYQLPVYVTNTMNVFGERQYPEKFIPLCIRKIRDGEKITIHSDPTQTISGSRFYIHAEDVADALLFLLDYEINVKVGNVYPGYNLYHPDFGGATCPHFNIVGAEEVTNLELAKIITQASGVGSFAYELKDFHTSRPGHDLRYALDGSYMKKLGWAPKWTLRERIKEVVDWSLANPDWIEATT